MTSQRIDALDAKIVAIEAVLKSRESLLRGHDSLAKGHSLQLSEHSSKLGSLMTSVGDITLTLAAMRTEMREGLQSHHASPGSSGATVVLTEGQGSGTSKGKEPANEPVSEGLAVTDNSKVVTNDAVVSKDYYLTAKRIELPVFNGVDPVGWVARAEAYFSVQGTPAEMRIQYAQICMEGTTWHWFKVLKESDSQLDWERFKHSLFERYGGVHFGNPFAQLKGLVQEGTLDEYVEEFEMLIAQVPPLSEEQYMGLYLGGLREDVRMEVLSLDPSNRFKMISISRAVERKLRRGTKGVSGGREAGGFRRNVVSVPTVGGVTQGTRHTNFQNQNRGFQNDERRGGPSGGTQARGVRNISHQEHMDRRAKGLCFKCGQHYSPTHQCPEKQLRLLIWEEDETGGSNETLGAEEEPQDQGDWELVCNRVDFNEIDSSDPL